MFGKSIAGDFIAIAGEMRRFPASNENTELYCHTKKTIRATVPQLLIFYTQNLETFN